jgi:hypothetical protein
VQCVAVADKKHQLSARMTVCETSSRASPAFPFHLRVLHQQQQENGTNGTLAKLHASEKVTHILSRQVVVAPAALSPRHCSGRSC